MPWCPRCDSLPQHESKGAHKDVTHRSVTVQSPVGGRDESLLVWTMMLWRLTANVALGANPDLTYMRAMSEGETFILSEGTAKTHRLN